MSSYRRLALLLALGLAAVTAALAQSSSSSSTPAAPATDQAQAPAQNQGQMSVQARIKARRAQRRAAAIHEAYDHRYDAEFGFGYLRFVPGPGSPAIPATHTSPAVPQGPGLEHAHEYAWNLGFTRYFDERLGATVDARGYYATAYVYNNQLTNSAITNPAIIQYAFQAGPTYRFYLQPKFSVSGRILAGIDNGNFSGDVNHNPSEAVALGLWPDGNTFAASASVPVEYNVTPRVALRVAPEYFFSGFGSTIQYTRGFTTGLVYRFGKQ
jgi:hypothetical protein